MPGTAHPVLSQTSESPGYRVKVDDIAILGGETLQIRSLFDRCQYDDQHGEALRAGISPAAWPLFGQIWPSALSLADLMQCWDFGSRRVLELGCGLALASLVVHRRAGDITASDCHPLVLPFLLDNLRRNGLPPMKYEVGNWAQGNPRLGEFDLIIGSDVLYERDHASQLATFIDRHARPHADVLIVDPCRSNRSRFSSCLQQSGFSVDSSLGCDARPDARAGRQRFLRFQR